MSKLTVTEFVTLDGVIEAPGGEAGHPHSGWVFDFMSEEQQRYKLTETLEASALLLGRRTYDGFSAAWPERDGEFADKMNSMPKYVVSSTLTEPTWENTTVISLEEVPALKQQTDLLVAGSGSLVHALLQRGWVDELRMMIFPVVLGSGLRLFPDSPDKQPLALTHTEAFPTGVVVHHYSPAGPSTSR
jgi:dihydrofolate reductase